MNTTYSKGVTLHEIDICSAPHGPTPRSTSTPQTPTDRGDPSRSAHSGVVSPPVTCMIKAHHQRVRRVWVGEGPLVQVACQGGTQRRAARVLAMRRVTGVCLWVLAMPM